MSSAAFQPRLRLVGGDEPAPLALPLRDRGPMALRMTPADAAVIKENRLAAHAGEIDSSEIDPRDPRWVLAMQTHARLQGTMLTPERRDELMVSGRRLGLRPFESNLVIAVVQDRARREQPLRMADQTTGLIPLQNLQTLGVAANQRSWRWWLLAVAAAMVVASMAIMWLDRI